MPSFNLLFRVLLALLSIVLAQEAPQRRSVTVWSWPASDSSPQQLAQVSYTSDGLSTTVDKYIPPKVAFNPEDVVRVGFWDPQTSDWRGIATSAASFDPKYQQRLSLHVDGSAEAYHVGFEAYDKIKPKFKPQPPKKSKKNEPAADSQLVVEILHPIPGPTPHLNQKVVLNAEGKVDEPEQEKTFLQKYWWAILAFIALQVLFTGGAPEK